VEKWIKTLMRWGFVSVFIGTRTECESLLGMEYQTELGEFRVDDRTIVFDIELEPNKGWEVK